MITIARIFVHVVEFCGILVTGVGGLLLALILVAWMWDKAMAYSAQIFGVTTETWWEVLKEMHRRKMLRWQRRDGL